MKPGETLVIRVEGWPYEQVAYYQEDLDRRIADAGLGFRALVVAGDELAVAKGFEEHVGEALAVAAAGGPFADKVAQRGG